MREWMCVRVCVRVRVRVCDGGDVGNVMMGRGASNKLCPCGAKRGRSLAEGFGSVWLVHPTLGRIEAYEALDFQKPITNG